MTREPSVMATSIAALRLRADVAREAREEVLKQKKLARLAKRKPIGAVCGRSDVRTDAREAERPMASA